jgi:hypothetical protein
MSEEVTWENGSETQIQLETICKSKLGWAEASVLSVLWNEYVVEALDYVKEKLNENSLGFVKLKKGNDHAETNAVVRSDPDVICNL